MGRVVSYVRRVRGEGFSPREFRSICVTALVLLSAICITGAAVRLTGSGLGCSDWPNCSDTKLIDLSSKHAAIEQLNRLFTFLVCIGVALAAAAAWYRRPRRRDLLVLSMVMLLGVPAQGVVGAIVVLADLHPATVQLHFVLSMVLVWTAVTMLWRSGEADGGTRVLAVDPSIRRHVLGLAIATGTAVLAGTVVTGTGPHAGDEKARRFFGTTTDIDGTALSWVTRVHGAVVWVAVATALALLWRLRSRASDRQRLDAPLVAWVVGALVQGAVGYVQYAAGLPAGLVLVHVAGATTLVGITSWLWNATGTVSR
jgi:heme a synthase